MNSNFVHVGFGWLRALNPQPVSHCTQRIVLNGLGKNDVSLSPCLATLQWLSLAGLGRNAPTMVNGSFLIQSHEQALA